MAALWFSASPLVALVVLLASLTFGQQETPGVAKGRESNPVIAFPGLDAFGHISGLKDNSSSAASVIQTPKPSRPEGSSDGETSSDGGGAIVGEGASLPPASSECTLATLQRLSWRNVSPFYSTLITAGHQRLPDVRLAVDSMFRLSTMMESLLRDPSGTNLLYSPVGLVSTLGQLMLAARGRTLHQLQDLLIPSANLSPGCNASDLFHASFRSLLAQVWSRRGSESYELSVRNALFHQQPPPTLNRDFTRRLAREYATEIFPTDFKNSPIYAQQQVNLWAQRASKGKIDQLIPYIPPRTTTSIISSVIYFKAIWENKFSKKFTIKSPFYLDGDYRGRTKSLDFMSGDFDLPYVESKSLGCKMVVLPYTNNETAMYLVMPLGTSKWKSPRTQTLLSATQRDSTKDDDSLLARSAVVGNIAPLTLSPTTHHTTSDQGTYNIGGIGGGAAYSGTWRNGEGRPSNTQQQASHNPSISVQQRRRRRQTERQQETTSGYNPCQGRAPCQLDAAAIGDSPFSATRLHELANRLGAEEFNSLVVLAKRSKPAKVSLFIPRLSMSTNVKLREALAALGVDTVFSENSDLSGAVNQSSGVGDDSQGNSQWAVNEVWQQSRLDVTEEGTEAASGTAAVLIDYSLNSYIFKADSPFLAVIRHEATGTPIFWASVANPS